MVKLLMKLFVVDKYLGVGLVWLCGPSVRPLQASDPVLCISMKPCRGGLPSYATPRSGVELLRGPQRDPIFLPVGSLTSHWEDWSFVTMYFFARELATTPLLSSSPWVQAHLFSRACSFSARNWQGDF